MPFLELWHEPTEVATRPPLFMFPLAVCQHISPSLVPADNEWTFVVNFETVAIRFSCNSRQTMIEVRSESGRKQILPKTILLNCQRLDLGFLSSPNRRWSSLVEKYFIFTTFIRTTLHVTSCTSNYFVCD